ncbi:hypothetical protein HC251_12215 [Iamia sp. SCSIO 61187]|uniref:hypothetical protein n=1 Tax=Iamia sp. SCSIO 61187 TaxID=2722752 RepID=UPI001C6260E2|nr:hypothetical protein [Iamia sp. SCSIO 61187]QYG93123.1 hypothetical protein HC251_12215 [Iamia sp. SCSIO 61187]
MSTVVLLSVLAVVIAVVIVVGVSVVVGLSRPIPPPAGDWEVRLAAVRPVVVRQLWERRPVEAVKTVRSATGLGLAEAKQVTDAIAFEERVDPRRRRR